jgi:hypothetical protein
VPREHCGDGLGTRGDKVLASKIMGQASLATPLLTRSPKCHCAAPRRDLAAPRRHSGGFSRKIRGGRFVLGQSGSAAFPAASGAYCWLREPIRPGSSQSARAHSRTMFGEAELINNRSVRDVNKRTRLESVRWQIHGKTAALRLALKTAYIRKVQVI